MEAPYFSRSTYSLSVLADLETGMQVTVISERADDGSVVATSINVTPDGASGFGGWSFGQ